MNNLKKHTRINDILLGRLERPALQWMAAHSPRWMTPDLYTTIGFLGYIIIMVGYILSWLHPAYLWLANFGFVVNWVGDSLDGTLARHRHIERPIYGFFIDHTIDAIGQVMIFTGMGLSPYVSFNVACLTLVAYLLLSVLAYIRTYLCAEFKISYGKLGPTEARVIAILVNTSMFIFGRQFFPVQVGWLGTVTISPYDIAVGAIGLLLLTFFLTTAIQEAIRLGKAGQ